eukprot:4845748-Prymnesium_polylepis.1
MPHVTHGLGVLVRERLATTGVRNCGGVQVHQLQLRLAQSRGCKQLSHPSRVSEPMIPHQTGSRRDMERMETAGKVRHSIGVPHEIVPHSRMPAPVVCERVQRYVHHKRGVVEILLICGERDKMVPQPRGVGKIQQRSVVLANDQEAGAERIADWHLACGNVLLALDVSAEPAVWDDAEHIWGVGGQNIRVVHRYHTRILHQHRMQREQLAVLRSCTERHCLHEATRHKAIEHDVSQVISLRVALVSRPGPSVPRSFTDGDAKHGMAGGVLDLLRVSRAVPNTISIIPETCVAARR